MKTTPLLFKAPNVRAILDGRQTQTRRLNGLDYYNQSPDRFELATPKDWINERPPYLKGLNAPKGAIFRCRNTKALTSIPSHYGYAGDLIWVRESTMQELKETWISDTERKHDWKGKGCDILYCADFSNRSELVEAMKGRPMGCRPSVHMSRWASRLTLKITDVRVERLQDISEGDAKAEGIDGPDSESALSQGWYAKPRMGFRFLWNSINEKCGLGWDFNPWVWRIEFEAIKANVDKVIKCEQTRLK